MARREDLGPFEREVLEALAANPVDAYGVSIIERISQRTGRTPSVGGLYTTLERLEKKGFVRSHWGKPTPERGGRRKRHYAITGAGVVALRTGSEKRAADWPTLAPVPEGAR